MAEQLLSEKLKIRTLVNHQQLEKQLVFQLRNIRNKEHYVRVLQLFYSYFTALEHKISRHIGTAELIDLPQRRKSENLLLDLNAIYGKIPLIAPDDYLPEIIDQAQAFGALYVMEGSTLGGQVIAKMVEKQLGLATGTTFFKGYGDQTLKMWNDFKLVLDAQPDDEKIIRSADATFAKFSLWITHSISN
jgi:heme oxygenase